MKVTEAQALGNAMRLELDGADVFLYPEWRPGIRDSGYVPIGDDIVPGLTTIIIYGEKYQIPGITNDKVIFALYCDFWYGVPGEAMMPVPDEDDPYVTAPRPRLEDDDQVILREIALRKQFGRHIAPSWLSRTA